MSTMADEDDEVGYGKPPKRARFRPGQSGNPAGRPRLATNFRTALLAELAKVIGDGSVTKQDALIRSLVDRAIAGQYRGDDRPTSNLAESSPHSQVPQEEAEAGR